MRSTWHVSLCVLMRPRVKKKEKNINIKKNILKIHCSIQTNCAIYVRIYIFIQTARATVFY